MSSRRAVLKGTAAVAGLADPVQATPAGTSSGHPKANVLPAWKALPSWFLVSTRTG